MKLGALIFDVDGTLADTEEAHRRAFNEAFLRFGLAWDWSKPTYALLLATTGGKERIEAYIRSLEPSPSEASALTARIPAIHRLKTECYTRMVIAGDVPLREGVARLIEEAARAEVQLGIASTTTLQNIEALLRTHLGSDAMKRFSVVGAGDQVARKKPHPDIYDFVLSRLNVARDACVAIEDSANGLLAAKAAGLYTLVTPSYWTRTEDFSAADRVIPSLDSLLGIRDIERHLRTVPACAAGQTSRER